MTNDEVKAVWAANIDSHEKFQEAFSKTRSFIPRTWQSYAGYLPQRDGTYVNALRHKVEDIWPLQRDIIRESIGAYPEPTSVLKWLRTMQSNMGLGQMFPHVSPVDRTQIAFTPDQVQGKADRKQRMSVGRFLRKVLLFVPDSEIQRLDQQHRSELDTEFLLAQTVEAIHDVYVGMDGDSGCMRYEMGHFGHNDYHPSAVYCSPGMGVAYTMDSNDVVKSRSVVWVNPADAKDKRYVRIYGDPILKKKLEANGYRMAGLAGAKLTIYHDTSFTSPATVVMPWIDPAGGIHAHGVDRSMDSEYAVRFKGEDCITLVTSQQNAMYQKAGIYPVNVQSQSGHVDVPEIDTSSFHYTCAVTGKRSNRMDVPTAYWIASDGTVQQVREEAVSAMDPGTVATLRLQRDGRLHYAYCSLDTQERCAIPGFKTHFNDEDTRAAAGLAMLDKAFYADSERYWPRQECVAMLDAQGNHLYIKKEDALMLYDSDGGDRFIHIDMVKAMKSEGCVPVAVLNSYRGLAHKTHKHLAVTRGGKRVITGRHDVVRLWDGSWEYSRNAVTMTVAGLSLSISKSDNAREIVVPDEVVAERFEAIYKMEPERRKIRMVQSFARGWQGGGTWIRKGDTIVQCDYYNKSSEPWAYVDAANAILEMQGDSEWMQRILSYQKINALPWARVVAAAWRGMRAFDKERELMLAEANAVEAAPSTAAVIEKLNTLADADMDKLIAEVDDTLATSVVRRWPRLSGSPDGMGVQRVELPTTTNENGTLVPVHAPPENSWAAQTIQNIAPVQVTPPWPDYADNPLPAAQPVQVQAPPGGDLRNPDTLFEALSAAGFNVIGIDETTDFGPDPSPLHPGDAS